MDMYYFTKENLQTYRRIAQKAGGDPARTALSNTANASATTLLEVGNTISRQIVKPGETVVFSYIVFKSRAHRDSVNAKVMKDRAESNDGCEFDLR
jgi:uncharacterized protein YbaA (DUF1428 family)